MFKHSELFIVIRVSTRLQDSVDKCKATNLKEQVIECNFETLYLVCQLKTENYVTLFSYLLNQRKFHQVTEVNN